MQSRRFPAKILLFGEYAIIRGARALAVPFHDFEGRWEYKGPAWISPELSGLADYLEGLEQKGSLPAPLDLGRFRSDIGRGLVFDSSIPVGYGLGSSGALIAAVYDSYCAEKTTEAEDLQPILARMEGFFHGSSSGIDPLVCLLDRPLLLGGGLPPELVVVPTGREEGLGGLFLLDTGIGRETAPLVRAFLQKCENPSFDALVEKELGRLSNGAIAAFLEGDWEELHLSFSAISRFQWDHFGEMIPGSFRALWEKGLDSPDYQLKLCGAGGGGFLMGIARNLEQAREDLAPHPFHTVFRWGV